MRIKRRPHGALLALNALLLAALAATTFAPVADAQRTTAPRRARGEYSMVSGQVQGLAEAAIYIIDSNNAELVAVRWDRSRRTLAPLGFRDLAADGRNRGGSR